jgi:hypothetical protein
MCRNINILGWTKEKAQEIRNQFSSFAEDWDNDEDYEELVDLPESKKIKVKFNNIKINSLNLSTPEDEDGFIK